MPTRQQLARITTTLQLPMAMITLIPPLPSSEDTIAVTQLPHWAVMITPLKADKIMGMITVTPQPRWAVMIMVTSMITTNPLRRAPVGMSWKDTTTAKFTTRN